MAIDNNIQMYADKEKTQKIYPRTKADNVLMSDGKKVEDKISEISSDLEHKAKQVDLEVERKRIDNFVSLEQGSTTGDAELMDGRINILGTTSSNIGSSIRDQMKMILKTNILTKAIKVSPGSAGLISIPAMYLKGQTVKMSITNDSNIINSSKIINIGYIDVNGTRYDNIAMIAPNGASSEYTFNNNCKTILLWIDPSYILESGNINFNCIYKSTLYEDLEIIKRLDIEIDEIQGIIFGQNNIPYNKKLTSTCAIGYDNNGQWDVSLLANTRCYFRIDSDCVESGTKIALAITYKTSGEHVGAMYIPMNEEVSFDIGNEDIIHLRIWIDKSNIIKNGSLIFTVRNYSVKSLLNIINSNSKDIEDLKNKNDLSISNKYFSIIGDSYSTYKNWIPSGYSPWYADEGNSQTNNVKSVKDTWWWKLANETGMSLLTNSSYSGSTICNTGYSSSDSTTTSFITRARKDVGQEKTLQVKPNVIFVFGGTNDDWANAPIGSLKYSDWTTEDLKSVLPAFCYLMDYLKTWNPGARIINLVNTGLNQNIINGMKSACEHYEIENLVLSNIDKENGHPNTTGMESIKNQILSIL